jgi:putative transposase
VEAIRQAPPNVSVAAACSVLGVARATYYRKQGVAPEKTEPQLRACSVSGRALTQEQQQEVLDHLHSERFRDKAPPQVYTLLLDDGIYLCSVATMYRLLRKYGEVQERRRQRSSAKATRPELLAKAPREVWSWDITKLKGAVKWSYYYLYVLLDIYSRYVVGWCIAEKENAELAEALISETLVREKIPPGQLTLHADRGSAMTSKPVAALLVELGVTKSHSRPHTSDDNPFSESHFKTMKFRPEIPDRFGSAEEAREIFRGLFLWYNGEHRHSGIAMLSPEMVHLGTAPAVLSARAVVLSAAYAAHPERFVNQAPVPETLNADVWINRALPAVEASRDAEGDKYATPSICQSCGPASSLSPAAGSLAAGSSEPERIATPAGDPDPSRSRSMAGDDVRGAASPLGGCLRDAVLP